MGLSQCIAHPPPGVFCCCRKVGGMYSGSSVPALSQGGGESYAQHGIVHNWDPFCPGGAPASQPHVVAQAVQAEWLQPITVHPLRAVYIYLQRLGKTNTDNSGALLKRETACLQHNVECLFRNCRAKAHTCGPDLQSQSMGSLRTGSALTLYAANLEIPVLPAEGWICLFISLSSRASGSQRGSEESDLTPPQASGAGAGRLDPALCREPDSEAWQIHV